ncbi:MAG TPA: hypothetical protein PLD23_20560 [Armatimonadota bacterium]|nr:hypothetical protein [Armatimonadota bacterium]
MPLLAGLVGAIALQFCWYRARHELRRAGDALSRGPEQRDAAIVALQRSLRRVSVFGGLFRTPKCITLVELLLRARRPAEAEHILRQLLTTDSDPRTIAVCRLELSRALDAQWQFVEADAEAVSALELMERLNFPPVRVILERAELHHRRGDPKTAALSLRRALIRTDLTQDERDLVGLHYMRACIADRRPTEAFGYAKGASAQTLRGPHGPAIAECLAHLCVQFGDEERLMELSAYLDSADDACAALKAQILSARGEHEAALRQLTGAVGGERATGTRAVAAAVVLTRLGRLDQALELARGQLVHGTRPGSAEERTHDAIWSSVCGQLHTMLERWDEALHYLSRAVETPRANPFCVASARALRAGVLGRLGRADEAGGEYAEAKRAVLVEVAASRDAGVRREKLLPPDDQVRHAPVAFHRRLIGRRLHDPWRFLHGDRDLRENRLSREHYRGR